MARLKLKIPDIGVILLLVVFPLVITDGYKNITITKFMFFTCVSVLSLLICSAAAGVAKKKNKIFAVNSFNATEGCMIAFLLCGLVSVFVSDFPYNSLFGYAGRYMGYIFITGAFCTFFFASKYYTIKERDLLLFVMTLFIVCTISFLQVCGYNPLALYTGVAKSTRSIFLTTLGNITVVASFLSLAMPIATGMYCLKSHGRKKNIFLITAMASGFLCMVYSNSDSSFVGVLIGLWVVGFCCMKKMEYLRRFVDVALVCSVMMLVYRMLTQTGEVTRRMCFVSTILTSKYMFFVMLLLIIVDVIIRHITIKEAVLRKCKTLYLYGSLTVISVVLGVFMYFSVIDTTTSLGKLEDILRYSDSWGTDRGNIWRICMEAYKQFPLRQKLFGFGEDSILILLSKYCKAEMRAMCYYTNNAHNEYIQYLLTVGLVGLMTYIGAIITAVNRLLKSDTEDYLKWSVLGSVVAYSIQSAINITQPITTPLFFLFLAFACSMQNKTKIKIPDEEVKI